MAKIKQGTAVDLTWQKKKISSRAFLLGFTLSRYCALIISLILVLGRTNPT